MHPMLRIMIAAATAVTLLSSAAAAQSGPAPADMKQIQLTEKQVQGVIAAQKDVSAIFDKMQGEGAQSDELPPKVRADLDVAVKKHGFKDFSEYDEVIGNITLVMTGIDPKTKAFTEPAVAIKKEIAEVTANKSIPAREKKQMLDELKEAQKAAQPIQFPGNVELVKKYYDKIDAALN
jgi:homoserine dehydrogenase